jgi:hypothetical protein
VIRHLPDRLFALEHFHHGRGSVFFLLEWTLILDIDFPSLYAILQSELPTMDLYYALSTITVFHTAVLLIKDLSSQKMKCGNGPRLMNSLVLSCSSLFRSRWLQVEWSFGDSVTAVAR